MKKTFKKYMSEAFSAKSFDKAVGLIERYMSKKVGELYKDSEPERFKKIDGTLGIGIRYYLEDGRSIRYNWLKGTDSAEVSSIDLWQIPGKHPTYTIDVEGMSFAKWLVKATELIQHPRLGDFQVNESVEEFEDKTRMDEASKIEQAMQLLQQGVSPADIKKKHGIYRRAIRKAKDQLGMAPSVNVSKGSKEKVGTSPMTLANIKDVEDDIKVFKAKMGHLGEMATAIGAKVLNSLLITGKAGTGKSFTIEKMFSKAGLKEGEDWVLVKAGVSAIGAYQLMYHWRDRVIVFDDADGIFESSEGRGLLKGALDDKKIRRISWLKESNVVFPSMLSTSDPEGADKLLEKGKVPNSFDYNGSCVFITNMTKEKADPDKAIRSRSMVININPSQDAMIERLESLLPVIEPKEMGIRDKKEVFKYIKAGVTGDSDITLRKFTKAAKIKLSGMKSWKQIVENYA